jgi:hypothetical protein
MTYRRLTEDQLTDDTAFVFQQGGVDYLVPQSEMVDGAGLFRRVSAPAHIAPTSSTTAVSLFSTVLNVDLSVVGSMIDIETYGTVVNNTGTSTYTATFGAVTGGFAYCSTATPALTTSASPRWWRHRMRVITTSAGNIYTAQDLVMGNVLNLASAVGVQLTTNGPSSAAVGSGPVSVYPQGHVSNAGLVLTPQMSFISYSQV